MDLQKNINGAWEDIENLKRYEAGAWVDCESAKKYADGAWQEVWSSGYKFDIFEDDSVLESAGDEAITNAEIYVLGNNDRLEINSYPDKNGGDIVFSIYGEFVNPKVEFKYYNYWYNNAGTLTNRGRVYARGDYGIHNHSGGTTGDLVGTLLTNGGTDTCINENIMSGDNGYGIAESREVEGTFSKISLCFYTPAYSSSADNQATYEIFDLYINGKKCRFDKSFNMNILR